MSQSSPADQAEEPRSRLKSPSQAQPAQHVLPVASNTIDADDNPRSPKRRRISSAEDGTATDDVSKPSLAEEPALKQNGENAVQHVQPESTSPSAQDHHDTSSAQNAGANTQAEALSTLDSQAAQILTFLSRLTPAEALGLSNMPNAVMTREYAGLRAGFDQTRRSLSHGWPFLAPDDLKLRETNHVEIVRRANQAIFMSSIFTGEIGLRDMDRSFLAVFVPDNGKLLKAQASIYLELKTQGFITAWRTGAAPPHVVMADMFGPDLDKAILARRPGTTSLAPSEQDFLNRLSSRREILQSHVKNNTLDQLPGKYRWEDFNREVSSYLTKTIENTSNSGDNYSDVNRNDPTKALQRGQMEGQFSIHGPPLPVPSTESILSSTTPTRSSAGLPLDDDFVAQAARAAEIALQESLGSAYSDQIPKSSSPNPVSGHGNTPTPQPASSEYQKFEPILETAASKSPAPAHTSGGGEIPHASQTAPTSVLYERARLAAPKTVLPPAKNALPPSQRRPWTTGEENALMTGLDQVKGPHWSQILAMYGPGGTVSEALKDRNQVQLKDKARNLKLFFLKSGIEVPYYLKHVTGDLRTRAPGQASKQEAKERDRLQADGDDAAFDLLEADIDMTDQLLGDSTSNQGSPVAEDPGAQTGAKATFDPSMADVEAMIARAAAQAAQSLGQD